MSAYLDFLARKAQFSGRCGFAPTFVHPAAYDFQSHLVDWACRQGRAAIFADCGLGKTLMQLTWAHNVVRHTNKPVLILSPLSVSLQTVDEARKFDLDCTRSQDGAVTAETVTTNYERLDKFDPDNFAGVVCDESSILKNFDGARKAAVTEFMRKVPYRLLCTATAAPNDYIELGTSSEALGHLGYTDMLTRFFKNDQHTVKPTTYRHGGRDFKKLENAAKWRFKGHAEIPFWRFVCSWARACRKPSDLGFDDEDFILPPLTEESHLVEARSNPDGKLFALPAVGLDEQREERRRTIRERCERVAELVNGTGQPALVWCHLNEEGDLLAKLIPDAVQVSGKDSDDAKEEKLFGFARGDARILITKPKIGAWGLNFQRCAHVTFFPSHSFEQYYQGVRRCWRFGQMRPVKVDVVTTEGEKSVLANLQRKARAADQMFSQLVDQMHDPEHIDTDRKFTVREELPSWL